MRYLFWQKAYIVDISTNTFIYKGGPQSYFRKNKGDTDFIIRTGNATPFKLSDLEIFADIDPTPSDLKEVKEFLRELILYTINT